MHVTQVLTAAAACLSTTTAWNTDVHNQIGLMAETLFTPTTKLLLSNLLEPQYHGSVGRAAAWADAYAHTDEGRFSFQWHWIDTHDHPPQSCALNYTSDCAKGGCVVSAIANQTGILRSCIADARRRGDAPGPAGANLTCSYALKWVAHFLGDIAQPLHASGRAAGGNLYEVNFGGVKTELHAVWDGFIPYYAAGVKKPFSNHTLEPFFEHLVYRIRNGGFYESPESWLACTDPSTPVECATRWAEESNKWTCSYVYRHLHGDEDLGLNGYAAGGVPIVELQISKAAYRLATWLNKLVEEEEQEVIEL